jgi:hypothetical protein
MKMKIDPDAKQDRQSQYQQIGQKPFEKYCSILKSPHRPVLRLKNVLEYKTSVTSALPEPAASVS